MAHRTYRLCISPERDPEVRRVVDFDGRSSLEDVHLMIQETFELDADHLYAFYLSGKYFDGQTEYGDGDAARPAHTALLFRLGLREGKRFVYLFDFGDELRHTLSVLSVTDVEVPLEAPRLVESVGKAPPQYSASHEWDEDEESESDEDEESDGNEAQALPHELGALEPLVVRLVELDQKIGLAESEPDAALLRELAQAALELGSGLATDIQLFAALNDLFAEDELDLLLLELPKRLSLGGEIESALAVARAFTFLEPDQLRGELALVYARAGQRAEAEAQIAENLTSAENASIAEGMAGEAYKLLGEPASAEAYYQRSLAEAADFGDRKLALARMVAFLMESGREREAQALLERERPPKKVVARSARAMPAVGRNEPCPCGSGKKYKKCHGAPGG